MDNLVLVVLVLVLLLAGGAVAVWAYRRRRTERLREHFGQEYDRIVQAGASRSDAEALLEARARRVASLQIRELDPETRERIGQTWETIQARFADDPRGVVADADRLLGETMQAMGYPVGHVEQCAADLSVHHPDLVEDYRRAHEICRRTEREPGDTEELRRATVAYRALIGALVHGRERRERHHDRAA